VFLADQMTDIGLVVDVEFFTVSAVLAIVLIDLFVIIPAGYLPLCIFLLK
jgi:hypothetical protein